jgi:hypothetical protein
MSAPHRLDRSAGDARAQQVVLDVTTVARAIEPNSVSHPAKPILIVVDRLDLAICDERLNQGSPYCPQQIWVEHSPTDDVALVIECGSVTADAGGQIVLQKVWRNGGAAHCHPS